MADHLRRRRLAQPHDGIERHHLAASASARRAARDRRIGAKALIGLHVDAIGAVVEIEVVDVLRAEEHLQGVGDLAHRQSKTARPVAIDVDDELRIVGAKRREQARDPAALVAGCDQRLCRARQPGDVAAGLVEHFELEAAEHRQPLNGWRRKRHDHAARNAEQLTAHAIEHGVERLLRPAPLAPVLAAARTSCRCSAPRR